MDFQIPTVIHLPFARKIELLLVQNEQAIRPTHGLQQIMSFEADNQGGWICAAKAGNDKWGYLNHQGEWIIPPKLDDARTFADGIARFCENGLWGYINLQGEIIAPAQYVNAAAFRKGFARVMDKGWGFINDRGEKIIATKFLNATDFCEGLASVEVKSMEWKIINTQGDFTSPKCFTRIDTFSQNGLAAATLSSVKEIKNNQIKIGFINSSGEWVIEPKFADAKAFDDSLYASVSLDKRDYGLIDQQGNWFVEPKHEQIYSFNECGLAFFEDRGYNIKHGFIDAQGMILIEGGYDLKSHMPCGIARENCRYINARGERLSVDSIQYGIDFDDQLQAAIVNINSESAMGTWAMLQTNGDVCKVPDSILEPLVTHIGWVDLQVSSCAVPFLNKNNGISWLNGKAEEIYSATAQDGIIELKNAQDNIIWTSSDIIDAKIPEPFFNTSSTGFFRHISNTDEISAYASKLLVNSESRLQSFINQETLSFEMINQEEDCDFDYSFQELFDYDDDELEDEGVNQEILQSYLISEHQKVLHVYQNEFHSGTYNFLWDAQVEQAKQLRLQLINKLTQMWGKADPDPEFIAWWGKEQHRNNTYCESLIGWRVPLQKALSDRPLLPDENYQWLILLTTQGTGDGDQWLTSWLMTAPSADAMYTAKALRNNQSGKKKNHVEITHKIIAPDVDIPEIPNSYEGWFEIVTQHAINISEIPEQWIDDNMIDAAIVADMKALAHTPAKWQTTERLTRLITQDLQTALKIPPQCMTEQVLDLARSLYAKESEWNSHDKRCCELPTQWDQDSFYGVWGCLLNQDMARKGIIGGASLGDLPIWLRSDEIETLAAQVDIDNLRYLDKKKITPQFIARVTSQEFGSCLENLPFELLTPTLCLDSIKNHQASLDDIPAIVRTPEVCVEALKHNFKDFIYIPNPYRIEVIDQLFQQFSLELTDAEDTLLAYLYDQRAWAKLWTQDYQGAIDDINLSIEKYPDEADAHYILASAYFKLGKTADARREAEKVLSLDSEYKTPWTNEKTQWLHQLIKQESNFTNYAKTLQENPTELQNIPREEVTEELIQIALTADPSAIRYVPKRFMNSERYLLAFIQKHKEFWQIPKEFMTEEICIDYVSKNGWNLDRVPTAFKTLNVCIAAVRCSSYAIKLVPEEILAKVEAAIANPELPI